MVRPFLVKVGDYEVFIPEDEEIRTIQVPDAEAFSEKELHEMVSNFVQGLGYEGAHFVWSRLSDGAEVCICLGDASLFKKSSGLVVLPYSLSRPFILEESELDVVCIRFGGFSLVHAASRGRTFYYEVVQGELDFDRIVLQIESERGGKKARVVKPEPPLSFPRSLILKSPSRLQKLSKPLMALALLCGLLFAGLQASLFWRERAEIVELQKKVSQLSLKVQEASSRLELFKKSSDLLSRIPPSYFKGRDPAAELKYLSDLYSRSPFFWVEGFVLDGGQGLVELELVVYGKEARAVEQNAKKLISELEREKGLKLVRSGAELQDEWIKLRLYFKGGGNEAPEKLSASFSRSGLGSRLYSFWGQADLHEGIPSKAQAAASALPEPLSEPSGAALLSGKRGSFSEVLRLVSELFGPPRASEAASEPPSSSFGGGALKGIESLRGGAELKGKSSAFGGGFEEDAGGALYKEDRGEEARSVQNRSLPDPSALLSLSDPQISDFMQPRIPLSLLKLPQEAKEEKLPDLSALLAKAKRPQTQSFSLLLVGEKAALIAAEGKAAFVREGESIGSDLRVKSIDPAREEVVLSGPDHDLVLSLKSSLEAWQVKLERW